MSKQSEIKRKIAEIKDLYAILEDVSNHEHDIFDISILYNGERNLATIFDKEIVKSTITFLIKETSQSIEKLI